MFVLPNKTSLFRQLTCNRSIQYLEGVTQMKDKISEILSSIGEEYETWIKRGSRHYLEVSISEQAVKLGYADLKEKYKNTYAIVPLKSPQEGMKARIDGRTFVNYAECKSGIAVPGYLARETGRSYKTFVPNNSMICNFT